MSLSVLLAAMHAEWIKLRTVRSTMWGFAATFGLTVGLGALLCSARVARWNRVGVAQRLLFEPIGFTLNGIFLAQLAIGVLGVLVMTSEYSTGQIRATFAAIPTRGTVLLAKIKVFGAVSFVVGLASTFVAFLVGASILSSRIHIGLGDQGALRCILGGAVYLTGIGLLGLGLGTILRRTAGAIAVLVALVLIIPSLAQLLPSPWDTDVTTYLPGPAGQVLFHLSSNRPTLSTGVGLVVFLAYPAIALLVGWVLLRRRDA